MDSSMARAAFSGPSAGVDVGFDHIDIRSRCLTLGFVECPRNEFKLGFFGVAKFGVQQQQLRVLA